ncbi:hypothetical protein [Paenirhodobacter populi]|uniref:Uncharacterized protein n=1 Tax=Paenirhodobacter populi TaxID=2306993 RepID=A0A443IMV2_9RHOB|nr:hypothetical protein [Sinirhodobacter populi]RWR07217.1 hypothetical protein D2T33_17235 [Sinirhodobacter populi]
MNFMMRHDPSLNMFRRGKTGWVADAAVGLRIGEIAPIAIAFSAGFGGRRFRDDALGENILLLPGAGGEAARPAYDSRSSANRSGAGGAAPVDGKPSTPPGYLWKDESISLRRRPDVVFEGWRRGVPPPKDGARAAGRIARGGAGFILSAQAGGAKLPRRGAIKTRPVSSFFAPLRGILGHPLFNP